MNIDPLTKKYPHYTPYSFSGNKVINSRELEGLEEYSSYDAYAVDKGKDALKTMNGSDGAWLTSDRESRSPTWSKAMEYVTKNNLSAANYLKHADISKSGDRYSFEIVRDYYGFLQHNMDNKGFKSKWAIGASYLCDELADTFQDGATSGNLTPLGPLLKELNLGIAQYAIGKFNKVLYKNEGVKDWYDWDSNFILEEQVTKVAPKVYKRWEGTFALSTMSSLSEKSGLFYFAGSVSKHFFPSFATFNTDVSDAKTNFGASGRFHIPMLMLYTSEHAEKNWSGALYYNSSNQKQEIEQAHESIMNYYNTKMKY
jgi:hypothetical protein